MAKREFKEGDKIEHEGKTYVLANAIDLDRLGRLENGSKVLWDEGLLENNWMVGEVDTYLRGKVIKLSGNRHWYIFPYRLLGELTT